MQQRKAEFFCPISLPSTRRIHPASFQITRGATGHLIRLEGKIYCVTVGVHPTGFVELALALRWISDHHSDLPVLVGMEQDSLKVGRCVPFPEQVILDLIQDEAA